MEKVLFACDLDNTLIHSARHKVDGDVCIEKIGEKEQGFISPKTVEFLKEINKKAIFLPVTTRSIEQYLRIKWPEGCAPSYALVANGGILLNHEKVDEDWLNMSKKNVLQYQNEYQRLLDDMVESNLFIRQRMVDDLYLFGYCKDGVDGRECQRIYQEKTSLNVILSGRKLYILSNELQKGVGVEKFQNLYKADKIYSAGDSIIDVTMLSRAKESFIPNEGLKNAYEASKRICPSGVRFSEFVTESICKLLD